MNASTMLGARPGDQSEAGRCFCRRSRGGKWLALGQTALLAVCVTWAAGGLARAETTLKMVPHANLVSFDPIWTLAGIALNHGYMIYDTLFAMDSEYRPQPQMVERYAVSDGGLKYTFTLRKGLKWHDGAPVTSRDCTASLRRWGARDALGRRLMAATQALEVVDSKTFTLTLKEPFAQVLEALGKPGAVAAFMMPERVALTDPFKQIQETIGSGPFKFVKEEWVQGAKVVYVKNGEYVPRDEPPSMYAGGKRVLVDRVEWITIPDANSAVAALIRGEVDMLDTVPHDFIPLLRGNPKVQVRRSPTPWQVSMIVNHLQPPFNNVKARQALYSLVRQEDYLLATVGNPEWFQLCWAMFTCGSALESDAGARAFKQDLEVARRLLREAGYNGEKVVILDGVDLPVFHNTVPVTAQLLRAVGVNVEIQAMDLPTLFARRTSSKPVAEGGWTLYHTSGYSFNLMSPASHNAIDGGCEKAMAWYCDPQLEALKARWVRTGDPDQRKSLAQDIQKRAYEQGAYVPLGQMYYAVALSTRVKGNLFNPTWVFWNTSKE